MAYQFGNLQQQQHQQQSNRPSKRRMDDDEPTVTKRHFDLNTQFSPDQPLPQQSVPAITYASPDYRPPPRDEIPLWLQPVVSTAASPMTEDESEDESVLLTPSYLQGQQQKQQQTFGRPAVEYWGNMMIDQWQ